MENQNQIFRKKSLEGISSPDQLQDYMRVTSPSVWMILAAVILLLGGLVICSIVGTVEDTIHVDWKVENGIASGALADAFSAEVSEGMQVRIDGKMYSLRSVVVADDYSVKVYADVSLQDGTYDGEIIIGKIAPISFLWNTKDNL